MVANNTQFLSIELQENAKCIRKTNDVCSRMFDDILCIERSRSIAGSRRETQPNASTEHRNYTFYFLIYLIRYCVFFFFFLVSCNFEQSESALSYQCLESIRINSYSSIGCCI